ncbi:hypothetical protein ACHAXT_006033 [Thalassiosira profunda]
MQLPVAIIAAALVGIASAKDPPAASRPARKRSQIKHQSKVKTDEAFDPFFGRKLKKETQPPRGLLGEDYCTWGFDYECYAEGKPACCFDDSECPEEQPPCDLSMSMSMPRPIAGKSYCTWSPEYTCYADGWPECCGSDEECPEERPGCDIDGASYCTYSPDDECYADGWPACCGSNETCPEEQPPCEIAGASYCTWSPNKECYADGWPACCGSNETCPEEQPPCDIDGASYCTWSPDEECYADGWPACCGSNNETCPEEQPPCDVVPDASNDVGILEDGSSSSFVGAATALCAMAGSEAKTADPATAQTAVATPKDAAPDGGERVVAVGPGVGLGVGGSVISHSGRSSGHSTASSLQQLGHPVS